MLMPGDIHKIMQEVNSILISYDERLVSLEEELRSFKNKPQSTPSQKSLDKPKKD